MRTDMTQTTLTANNFDLPTLVLRDNDIQSIEAYLDEQHAKLGELLTLSPLVIDLSAYPSELGTDDLALIVGTLRARGMHPVAVSGANKEQLITARLLELAVMPRKKR
jgi:septum site-determining protein MinC